MGITGKTEQKTKKRQVEIYGNIFFNLLLWLISMSFRVLIKAKVFDKSIAAEHCEFFDTVWWK